MNTLRRFLSLALLLVRLAVARAFAVLRNGWRRALRYLGRMPGPLTVLLGYPAVSSSLPADTTGRSVTSTSYSPEESPRATRAGTTTLTHTPPAPSSPRSSSPHPSESSASQYRSRIWTVTLVSLMVAASACVVPGCTAAEGKAIGGIALALGEQACDALLPLALPQFGALDVLVCKGVESLVSAALKGEAPVPPPEATLSGAGGLPPRDALPHRPIRYQGRTVALVRAHADVVARAQARVDAVVVAQRPIDAGADR